jgi:hypothetical protein
MSNDLNCNDLERRCQTVNAKASAIDGSTSFRTLDTSQVNRRLRSIQSGHNSGAFADHEIVALTESPARIGYHPLGGGSVCC